MIRAPSGYGPGRTVGCATLRKQRAQEVWVGWGQSNRSDVTRCLRGASAGGRLRSDVRCGAYGCGANGEGDEKEANPLASPLRLIRGQRAGRVEGGGEMRMVG